MSLSLEQVVAYLDRIRYSLSSRLPRPDLNLLTVLHELHTRFVTFENMSIIVPEWREVDMTSGGLKLDVPSLFNKIVKRNRGGYCFEVNTLFAALLAGLGYTVRSGAARVVMDGMEINPEKAHDHLYLMTPYVHSILFVSGGMLPPGHLYLCDVGYGGNTLTTPTLIPTREEITAAPTTWGPPSVTDVPVYRLRWGKVGTPAPAKHTDVDKGYYLQIWANRPNGPGSWHDLYYFNLSTFGPMDFAAASYFTSTFPGSLFTKGPFCSRVTEKGDRFILTGMTLKYRAVSGVSETRELRTQEDLMQALRTHFGIEMPHPHGHLAHAAPHSMTDHVPVPNFSR